MKRPTIAHIILGLIILIYLSIATLYAAQTPDWQNPDEPAHYNVIAQIVEDGCCPIITSDDWDSDYLAEQISAGFPSEADISPISYEDHQPPLYYLIASRVYKTFDGDLFALRMFSVILGVGVILAAYVSMNRLLPGRAPIALATAAFVAFLPQHIAMMSSVNNDSLAELVLGILLGAAITYNGNPIIRKEGQVLPYDESSRPHAAALGGLAGIAFLTKVTIYLPAVLIVAVAILLRWRHESRSFKWMLTQVAWAAGMAIGIGGWWWLRDVQIYGGLDLFGLAAHDAVVVGQLRTVDHIADIGFWQYIKDAITITYHSYWGQFGWMAVPMPPRFYQGIGLFTAWNTTGIILLITTSWSKLRSLTANQRTGLWILLAAAAATIFNVVYYNLSFVQFQGRYLFTALTPFAGIVAAGSLGWVVLLRRWLPEQWRNRAEWLPLIAISWMPLLAIYALFRFIIPNLH